MPIGDYLNNSVLEQAAKLGINVDQYTNGSASSQPPASQSFNSGLFIGTPYTSFNGSGAFPPADGSLSQQFGHEYHSPSAPSSIYGQSNLSPPSNQNWSNAPYSTSQGPFSNPPWAGPPQPSMNPAGGEGSYFGGSQVLPQSSPSPVPSPPVEPSGMLSQALEALGLGKKENPFGYIHENTGSSIYTGTAPPVSYQQVLDQKNYMAGVPTGFLPGCPPQSVGVMTNYQSYSGGQSPPSMSQPTGFGNNSAPGPEPQQCLYQTSGNPHQMY